MALLSTSDTIYALASAPGKAGVALFRISGPAAREALVFLGVEKPLTPRMATLVTLKTPRTTHHAPRTIDSALALYFPAPHSFTGEDVVELHTHGSRAVTKMLLEALSHAPSCRLAEPGEFARRAFLNSKLDLAQAEGLADLIDAETTTQHRQAIHQLGGSTTLRVEALREAIIEPLALLEAYIDFPDEEIPESVLTQTTQRVEALKKELRELLDDGRIGEKIRDGLDIVILGAPNAGKSSLLNALARRDAAIVSAEAGTTRDLIEVQMEIGGYAVTLVDTAGIRETDGAIESEGIRRALARAERADMTLHLHDATEFSIKQQIEMAGTLHILTKCDLPHEPRTTNPESLIPISTHTGEGMDFLIAQLSDNIAALMESATSPLITRARHRESIRAALAALERFDIHAPLEFSCEELRLAATAIGKITGKIWVDDVLDLVFSRFCIGK